MTVHGSLYWCIVSNCKGEAVTDADHCIPYNQTELRTCILTACNIAPQ